MKIQQGIDNKIDLFKSPNVDTLILEFDKFQSILNGFRSKYPSLNGTSKQVAWAEKLRETEVYIASKMIFVSIYQREFKKTFPNADTLLSDNRINEIGNSVNKRVKSFTYAAQWIESTTESWKK